MTQQPVLAGYNLTKRFGQTEVIKNVDFEIYPGDVVAVLGPSGSGKSTLLHLLGGLLKPDAGQVYLKGKRLDNLNEKRRSELRLANLGFVFQFGDLVPELTVVENVELPLRLLGVKPKVARAMAETMLAKLDLANQANKRLSAVSGGEAQRASVARALIHSPSVILADEPTGALDQTSGENVLEELITAATEQNTAVVLVTHEMSVASWASRDILLRDGQIVTSSPSYVANPLYSINNTQLGSQ